MTRDTIFAPKGVPLNIPQLLDTGLFNSGGLDSNADSIEPIEEASGFNVSNTNLTELSFTLSRYGYSYSMSGFKRRLATGILLLHILMVLIYIIPIFYLNHSYYGLKSLCEVLILALNSAPSDTFAITSAGIERFDTYKHVKVGKVAGEKLEMVGGEEGGDGGFVVVGDGKE